MQRYQGCRRPCKRSGTFWSVGGALVQCNDILSQCRLPGLPCVGPFPHTSFFFGFICHDIRGIHRISSQYHHKNLISIYLDLCKGPRSVSRRWDTGGALIKTTIYYTLASLAYGPPPLGRLWARIGVPELPKGCFGVPKSPQSYPNIKHFMFCREDFTEL